MKWAICVGLGLAFLGAVLASGYFLPPPNAGGGRTLLSYDQFLSISLTAVTVILAVIALLIAYLAFEGKAQVIEKAKEIAVAEFNRLKPELIAELKNDARDQLMAYVSQEKEMFDQSVEKAPALDNIVTIPPDVEELRP